MSIMDTHEEYCEELKREVLRYTLEELHDGLAQASARNELGDYKEIYQNEINRRDQGI